MTHSHSQSHDQSGAGDLSELTTKSASRERDAMLQKHPVAIVGGIRTPFVRAGKEFKGLGQLDLGAHVVTSLIEKLELQPEQVKELVYGAVLLNPSTPNLAREIVTQRDLPSSINAHFVSNNCITGLVAINQLANSIATGQVDIGIAGGVESMSNPALQFSPAANKFFLQLGQIKASNPVGYAAALAKHFSRYRPRFAFPLTPDPREPSTGMLMGEHAEESAKEFLIQRDEQDALALRSHQNAAMARDAGYLADEIAPIAGQIHDGLIRDDTSLEKLAKLRSVFDKSKQGSITAGTSSALTDGASAICLMSEEEAQKQDREILGFIDGIEFAAINPHDGLLMAPALALPRLLERHDMTASDIDRFEVHEAFAAQVLANRQAWENGWDRMGVAPIGPVPDERMNVQGGSIALGHPFAATGGRVLMSLVNELRRSDLQTGVASVCAAGGMAAAILVRRA